ncbi:MAG: hypothetical protein M3P18_16900 [Actinomycetota bacterium]|nr:hypothetical protein [Actinomycetota bacterium]
MARDCEAVSGIAVAFCCPFCTRSLPETCASAAHAPSRRLSGKVVTLLCRWCNEGLSRLYERHVVPEIRDALAEPPDERKLTLRVGSGEPGRSPLVVPVRLRLRGSQVVELHVGPARGSPAVRGRWHKEARLIGTSGRGTFAGAFASRAQHRRAFLAWAFQAGVGAIGYRFALSPAGRVVADGLADPDSVALGDNFRIRLDGASLDHLKPRFPVAWSTDVRSDRIDAWGWRFGPYVALIPLPWDEDGRIYQRLDTIAASSTSLGQGLQVDADFLQRMFAGDRIEEDS